MSIKYTKTVKSSYLGAYDQLYVASGKEVKIRDIAKTVESRSKIPAIETLGIVQIFAGYMAENLLEGNKVTIDGLGSLYHSISKDRKGKSVVKILFRPSSELKKQLAELEFEEIAE